MVRGNSFNNVCVARRKRRRSFQGDHFRAVLPPAKKFVEAKCIMDQKESGADEAAHQFKVDLCVTRRVENGVETGESVVLCLLSKDNGENEIVSKPIVPTRTNDPKTSCVNFGGPRCVQSIDQILEDVGLTEIPDESVRHLEETGMDDDEKDVPTKKNVTENLVIPDGEKEAEQKTVCFAAVDAEVPEESTIGADVKKPNKDNQSSRNDSDQQETLDKTIEQQIKLLLSQHVPGSRDQSEENIPAQKEKQPEEDEVSGDNGVGLTPTDQGELKSCGIALVGKAEMELPSAVIQTHRTSKGEKPAPVADQTKKSLGEGMGQVCKIFEHFSERKDSKEEPNIEMMEEPLKVGNIVGQADETKVSENGDGRRTTSQGGSPSMDAIQGSEAQNNSEVEAREEGTISIQTLTTKISAKCRKSQKSQKFDNIAEMSKRTTKKRSLSKLSKARILNSQRKSKRRRMLGEIQQDSEKELQDVLLRRSKILSLRESLRKSLQSGQNRLKRKASWERMTGQIVAELTRTSLQRGISADCQVLESRCWNSEVQKVERGLCEGIDELPLRRKYRPMKKVSKESSLTGASANSVLMTDCTASVGGPLIPGRESVCSKPKVFDLVEGRRDPPGFGCESNGQAPRPLPILVPKAKVRGPVYRAPGLRRPKRGGLRLRMKRPD